MDRRGRSGASMLRFDPSSWRAATGRATSLPPTGAVPRPLHSLAELDRPFGRPLVLLLVGAHSVPRGQLFERDEKQVAVAHHVPDPTGTGTLPNGGPLAAPFGLFPVPIE